MRATLARQYIERLEAALRLMAVGLAAAGWAAMATGLAAAADSSLISIRTGEKTGVYYPAGGTICGLVNAKRADHGVRCLTQKSNGSIENLKAVRDGEATFGIVQSDWHFHAVRGTSVFKDAGPDAELRSLFSLHSEPFTVVARPDAGILRFSDLKGKRVNVGVAGSGSRATMDIVMEMMGWTAADFTQTSELATSALPRALCRGEIDTAVFIVGHPNLTVEDMVTSCDAALVPVEGPGIDRLVDENPYYFRIEIPAGTYPGQSVPAPVFALGATLVASSRTPPAIVYELVKAVFENFEEFRNSHPAFASLEKARMTTDGLTAPIHDGALRYYEDAGLN